MGRYSLFSFHYAALFCRYFLIYVVCKMEYAFWVIWAQCILPPQSKMQQQQLVCVNKQKISLKWQKSSHNSEKFPTIRNYTSLHIRPNNFVDLILEKIPKVYVCNKAMNIIYIITYEEFEFCENVTCETHQLINSPQRSDGYTS